jgi:hypothetical protein
VHERSEVVDAVALRVEADHTKLGALLHTRREHVDGGRDRFFSYQTRPTGRLGQTHICTGARTGNGAGSSLEFSDSNSEPADSD